MASVQKDPILQVETTCGSLLFELQVIGRLRVFLYMILFLFLCVKCLEIFFGLFCAKLDYLG